MRNPIAEKPPLHRAAELGDAQCVTELLFLGADETQRTKAGDAPLHLAVRNGNISCIRALIFYSKTHSDMNAAGDTPLHVAAGQGNIVALSELIKKFGYRPKDNSLSETPLSVAIKNDHLSVLEQWFTILAQSTEMITLKLMDGEVTVPYWQAYISDCINLPVTSGNTVVQLASISLRTWHILTLHMQNLFDLVHSYHCMNSAYCTPEIVQRYYKLYSIIFQALTELSSDDRGLMIKAINTLQIKACLNMIALLKLMRDLKEETHNYPSETQRTLLRIISNSLKTP